MEKLETVNQVKSINQLKIEKEVAERFNHYFVSSTQELLHSVMSDSVNGP